MASRSSASPRCDNVFINCINCIDCIDCIICINCIMHNQHISVSVCVSVRVCECVADCFSHVGTHVSHVQHIVRSLAFLPWRWPGTSLSHGTSTGPESVWDAIHKLQRYLACDSFTRWNAEGDYSDLFCVEKSRQKIHAVMQSHNFNRSNHAVLHAQSWRVPARGRFREKSPPLTGLWKAIFL